MKETVVTNFLFLVQKTVVINASKKETHNLSSGFKKLFRRLRSSYKVIP